MTPQLRITQKCGCPYCAGRKVNHTNSLWATHPHLAELLKDRQKGHELTSSSNKREVFVCKKCHHESRPKQIGNITRRGFNCEKCGDGISYPEKIMSNILDQLNIEYEKEKLFGWSKGKRYDFYIPLLNTIIETHGSQHYKRSFINSHRDLKQEKENDRLKELNATNNGIETYIVIDCRSSELDYIKNSILNSKLSMIFDLSKINWLESHQFACSNLTKRACELWNLGIKNSSKIAIELNLTKGTIIRYLKKGALFGWCDYDPIEVMRENAKKNRKGRSVIQLTEANNFIKEWSSISDISRSLKIDGRNISSACEGIKMTAGGFKWMYKEDYEKYINQAI